MKKNIWKIAITSALGITLLSGIFVGVNHAAFVNARTNQEVEVTDKSSIDWLEGSILTEEQIANLTAIATAYAETRFEVAEVAFMGELVFENKDAVEVEDEEYFALFRFLDHTGTGASLTLNVQTEEVKHFHIYPTLEEDYFQVAFENEASPQKYFTLANGEQIALVNNTWMEGTETVTGAHHLDLEEAADLAARWISETFHVSLENTRFDKIFFQDSNGNLSFWNGFVFDENGHVLFYYLMDAVTGEKLELERNTADSPFRG